ncbi:MULTISPECIES: hypothetical protein [Phyllobacteriaceae]|jgi:hypothetical protein|nr:MULTISPECIES: hypothetical protein [Mesorhizobium]MBN9237020.1 hypothetical protein [Mesorhizobium sp.]
MRPDRLFLLVAALYLLGGSALGVWMGVNHDFSLRPLHAHINLVGWASMALFGLTYRAFPEIGTSRLAWAHFTFALTASILFPAGLYQVSMGNEFGVIGELGVLLWLVSGLLFAVATARLASAKRCRDESSVWGLPNNDRTKPPLPKHVPID